MNWEVAFNALVLLTVVFAIGAFAQTRQVHEGHLLRGYLLAGSSLRKYRVVNLLWSASFSLNGMLYQVWLGYAIGAWALLPQAAWAVSFFLLARYSERIRSSDSLHGALGENFWTPTRRIAGIFSLLGATGLIGWEFSVGSSTFEGLFGGADASSSTTRATLLASAIVLSCVIYTMIGGLRGNALTDLWQSIFKLLGFAGLIVLLYLNFPTDWTWSGFGAAVLPPWSILVAKIGLWGLITNLAFSFAWQFVDMSAWQTAISGKATEDAASTRSALRWGGLWVFVAPGIIGTLLGIMLAPVSGVDQGNVLAKVVEVLPRLGPVWGFLLALTLISCMMSMIDGFLIAAGYALVVDILHPGRRLDDLDADRLLSKRLLAQARFAFFAMALVGSIGITRIIALFGFTQFDILYLVIIPHLSLLGPVLAALHNRRPRAAQMWLAIVFSAIIGVVTVVAGRSMEIGWVVEGAGVFTMAASYVAAILLSRRQAT